MKKIHKTHRNRPNQKIKAKQTKGRGYAVKEPSPQAMALQQKFYFGGA